MILLVTGAEEFPHRPHPSPTGAEGAFQEAARGLLERRRAQRGFHSLGDAHDTALVRSLASLASPMPGLREAGAEVGRHVYARRMFEDSYAGAVIVLSTCLLESGLGSLRTESHFHRTLEVVATPAPGLSADPAVLGEYLAGVMEGFLGEAFNCRASARVLSPLHFEVVLGSGRDVNALYGGARP